MSGSFCVYVAGMSLKIHGDIMCPPACLRVGRAPNHCHAVALHPGMCVCVGAVCTRVLGQAHLALHSGASRSWALPAGLPGRSSSPSLGPSWRGVHPASLFPPSKSRLTPERIRHPDVQNEDIQARVRQKLPCNCPWGGVGIPPRLVRGQR